ncbi:MAG: hypothetical protein Q7T86_03370 [Hyphomicrobiaceae bacterium]|nr:hypothetical protein [Hyphomicrobiaceae bacterium]
MNVKDDAPIDGGPAPDPRDAQIADLKEALQMVIEDIEDYQRRNNLSPSPGKTDCWQSVTHAKEVLRRARSAHEGKT